MSDDALARLVTAEHLAGDVLQPVAALSSLAGREGSGAASGSLGARIDGFRRSLILAAVEKNAGNWSAAARDLGVDRSNLHHLAKRLRLAE